ncbi:LamG-like jellyroll fold domain-containing protein [Sphaerisporangium sp. NPDC051017]|uniref:LamG-like jellyroll fold domain-containing protein n=1 Tax=Sphaerisporangium sp. NPDC051017 TaxID=3154636 RepID=UPI003429E865
MRVKRSESSWLPRAKKTRLRRAIAATSASVLMVSLLTVGAGSSAVADTKGTTSNPPPARTEFPRPQDPDAPLRAAIEDAKRQNQPIAVTGVFTETSRTWAFPDGHLVTDSYTGPAQLKQADGSWAWIDTSLTEQDGVLRPKLAKAQVDFSSGGAGRPFAKLTRENGQEVALSWPSALPKPRIEGNKAVYVGAAGPAADLVVTALGTGFSHDVVLRERPTEPLEIRIRVQTKGLALAKTKAGGLQLTDRKGKTVAAAGMPFMMAAPNAGPRAGQHRWGNIDTKVVAESGGEQTLVLKPDPKFLADDNTTFPVTVDPTVGLTVTADGSVESNNGTGNTTDAYLSVGTALKAVQVRVCSGSVCRWETQYAPYYRRSFIQFNTAPISGKAVISASMQLYGSWTGRCDSWPLTVSRATSSWGFSLNWANQPATTSAGASTISPACGTSWSTWDLTSMAKAWASGTANYGVGLQTTEPSWQMYPDDPNYPGPQYWRFNSADNGSSPPRLSVSYLLPPEIPTMTAESIDSLVGNDAISRSATVKTSYKSRSVDGKNIDYTVTLTDSTTEIQAPPEPTPTPTPTSTITPSATPSVTASPTPTPIAGLVAAYGMDQGSGSTVTDDSVEHNNGTTRDATWVDGKYGKALSFNGSSSWVTIPHAASLRLTNRMTLSAWVKPSTISGWRTAMMKDHAGGSAYGLYASNGTVPTAWMLKSDATSHYQLNGTAGLAPGTWTHLAATYDGSMARLYVNATKVSELAIGGGLIDDGGALHIGGNTKWGEYFSGVIDEVRVYNLTQSAAQIQADMNAQVAPPIPGNPPSAPGALTANPGEGKIALAWQAATDDYGISGYEIHRSKQADFTPSNTTKLATVTGLSYTNTDLPGTGTYYYRVIALDNTGQPGAPTNRAAASLKTLTIRISNIASNQAVDKAYELGSPETFKLKIKACLTGYPDLCNESPYYRITTDAPFLPTDTETGMVDPAQPILSGMVSRPSGGPVTAKYHLYDSGGVPVISSPLGTRLVNGGERASFQLAPDTVRPGSTYTWQMQACVEEICTAKTSPISFTTPGTPPPDPVEHVRHLTLSKDHFVIKNVKTDPAACDGGPCTATDSATMQIGGTGADKTVSVVGFRFDELPDGAGVSEGILKLGSPTCPAGPCPPDAVITATALKSPVTNETKGSDLTGDSDTSTSPYSLPLSGPQADIAGSVYQWLVLTSNKDEVITFADASAAGQPSLALTYLPPGPPSKVLNLTVSGGHASALASWGLPESNGSAAMLDGYDVEVTDNGGIVVKTLEVKDPYAAISGLANDVTYTVKVRAKTAFGVSDWEATTATTKAVPSPPLTGGTTCLLELPSGTHTVTAPAETDDQIYIDRVKAYYQAQDAVLEGHAVTIWDAPGVTPDAPSTAKLSLLNAALVEERAALAHGGITRTNSQVQVSNAVVQAMPDGMVHVTAEINRTWNEETTSTARTGDSATSEIPGQVEPTESTISIFVFDRCGNITVIQVVNDAEEDSTDFIETDGDAFLAQKLRSPNDSAAASSSRATALAGKYCKKVADWRGAYAKKTDGRFAKGLLLEVIGISKWDQCPSYDDTTWNVNKFGAVATLYTSPSFRKPKGTNTKKVNAYILNNSNLDVKSTGCFRVHVTTYQIAVQGNAGIPQGGEVGGGLTFGRTASKDCPGEYSLSGDKGGSNEKIAFRSGFWGPEDALIATCWMSTGNTCSITQYQQRTVGSFTWSERKGLKSSRQIPATSDWQERP